MAGSAAPHSSRAECMDELGDADVDGGDAEPGGGDRADGGAAGQVAAVDEALERHAGLRRRPRRTARRVAASVA